MNCRMNVADLLPAEKTAFVQALIDLKHAPSLISAAQADGAQGRYDDFVWIHNQVRGAAHNAPAFTPWHREFLYHIERELQDISGDPTMTIPYWDWTTARTPSDAGWPFTADFMGGLGLSASDSRVTVGRFATDAAHPELTEWRINIPDAETGDYLKRRGAAVQFPLPTVSQARTAMTVAIYDATPYIVDFNTLTQAQFNALVAASFRKFLEFVLHNGPHPWVGTQGQFNSSGTLTNAPLVGSMSWQASPNDPTFWLHHCNIDRLWAIWQQRYSYPGYIPQSGGPSFENGPDVMGMYNDPSFFSPPLHTTPNSNENHKSFGYIYFTDLPDVSPPVSPSINFGDVPEGLTTYKPVQFPVVTCRPVKFRITAVGGAGYSDPYPGAHTITPPDDANPFTADVYIAFHAPLGGSGSVPGSVTIEAFINDPDRLYVSVGALSDEVILGSWTVSLNATVVPRPNAAIALVLDRSGSMSLPAGGGLSRFDLLEDSLQVVADLMRDSDGMGLVYYDHNLIRRMNITAMTAGGGKANVAAAIADAALEPAGGNTAIGSGMIEGADVLTDEMGLPSTPYSRFAMLVMTDGNENVTPYANDPTVTSAVAPFASSVYAVGLGREGEVSDATLGAIATYMLITGDMDADEREFRMTKYFVQILAGITNTSIVVDPSGHLMFGVEHRVEFDLTTADMEADVILLSPAAFMIDIKLEAPDGSVLTPTTLGPNGEFQRHVKDAFYRLGLPALPSNPDGTHGGRWTAVISLSRERIRELVGKLDNFPELLERLKGGQVPYAVTVQTYSNVSLGVQVEQTSLLNGAELQLFASLKEYQAPLPGSGSVHVEVTDPTKTVRNVMLTEHDSGQFSGLFQTTVTGIYRCRFLASGHTLEGEYFTREETRTAAVYRRYPVPATPLDVGDSGHEAVCRMLECLLDDRGIQEVLKRHEVDVDHLRKCLIAVCRPARGVSVTQKVGAMTAKITEETKSPALARALSTRLKSLVQESGPLGIHETPQPEPLKAPPDQDIPMNPLGGMWPVLETEDGQFIILLENEEGRFDPSPDQWKKEEVEDKRREPKLPESLAKRLGDSAKKGRSRGRRKKE